MSTTIDKDSITSMIDKKLPTFPDGDWYKLGGLVSTPSITWTSSTTDCCSSFGPITFTNPMTEKIDKIENHIDGLERHIDELEEDIEFFEDKRVATESKVGDILHYVNDVKDESYARINNLQVMVENLITDNYELRTRLTELEKKLKI